MHLMVVGLSHKIAPIELREKLFVSEQQLPTVLANLKDSTAISECAILSTCNRTEVYVCASAPDADTSIKTFLSRISGLLNEELTPKLYVHRGHKAAAHLFRVASGVDSMVIGEQQILGQVKTAYAIASKHGASGPVLNTLFQQAITVGKRARTETEIARGAFSIGSVAVQLARSIFEELSERTVLVIGAGKMAELAITHLVSCGVKSVLVANRTHEKAEHLASEFNGQAVRFDNLQTALVKADIVITSTGAPEPIISQNLVLSVMRARRGRPIFFIDIAVPRDIEQTVGLIDNVFAYDIDDLQKVLEVGEVARRAEIAKVEALIAEQVDEFMRWFRMRDVVPIITDLQKKYEEICDGEMKKLRRKLEHLSEDEWNAIVVAARSIVRKVMHQPLTCIKQCAESEDSSDRLSFLRELFGIQADESKTDEKIDGS